MSDRVQLIWTDVLNNVDGMMVLRKLGLTKMYNSEVFDDYTKIQELFEKTKKLQDQTYYTQKKYKR